MEGVGRRVTNPHCEPRTIEAGTNLAFKLKNGPAHEKCEQSPSARRTRENSESLGLKMAFRSCSLAEGRELSNPGERSGETGEAKGFGKTPLQGKLLSKGPDLGGENYAGGGNTILYRGGSHHYGGKKVPLASKHKRESRVLREVDHWGNGRKKSAGRTLKKEGSLHIGG